MSREWNGKLLENNQWGDSLVTIIMEIASIPCAVFTTVGLIWWVYAVNAGWIGYLLAVIAGPIVGLFIAAAIGIGSVVLLVILMFAILPFEIGYDRYQSATERGDGS